ncbi:MAG: hypothetical protein EOP51_08770 [Sphingobacteriales bacterium]|nr:MAG: hypothetical protein EOP51_08770 [Sphingobacteriales bacterium]
MKHYSLVLLLGLLLVSSCKKGDPTDPKSNTPQNTFVPDTRFTVLVDNLASDNGDMGGMDIDPATGIIYFYQQRGNDIGFYIHAYNTNTQSYSTVFEYTDENWKSNSQVAPRIRVHGDLLFIPSGFNSIKRIVVLKGLSGNQLTFDKLLYLTDCYDIAFTADSTYFLTKSSGIISYDIASNGAYASYEFPDDYHLQTNASMVAVNNNGTYKLCMVSGSDNPQRLELRSLKNEFLKSVPTEHGGSHLITDSKSRIYYTENDQVVRYSADLSQKEIIKAMDNGGESSSNVYALKEFPDHIQLFLKRGTSLYSMNIKN